MMLARSLILAAVTVVAVGIDGRARAQNINDVVTALPNQAARNGQLIWNQSQATSVTSVLRGAALPKKTPFYYGDFAYWSNWLSEATDVLEKAQLGYVDLTSLCFFEYYHRHALLRAIAYNIIARRATQGLLPDPNGSGRLRVRILFAQYTDESFGFSAGIPYIATPGSVANDWAPIIGRDFLEEFQKAYVFYYGRDAALPTVNLQKGMTAWNQSAVACGPDFGTCLNNLVQLGVVWGYQGSTLNGAPVGPTAGWNHSKVVSNGQTAVVGGSNLLTNYVTGGVVARDAVSAPTEHPVQTDTLGADTGAVDDTDLKLSGRPAVDASRWVDALFWDYETAISTQSPFLTKADRLMGIITFESKSYTGKGSPCDCVRDATEPWCTSDPATYVDPQWGRTPYRKAGWQIGTDTVGIAGAVAIPAFGCFWGGWWDGRLDASWSSLGKNTANPPQGSGPIVLSAGERSRVFAGQTANAYTAQEVSAFDIAIGQLIMTASDAPGTEIFIEQQDVMNAVKGVLLERHVPDQQSSLSGSASTNQRWNLVNRIVKELFKGANASTLKVFLLKSEQGAYTSYPLYKTVDVLLDDVIERYTKAWNKPAAYGLPVPKSRKMTGTELEDQVCARILFPKVFRAWDSANGNYQPTRMHSKMVMVYSPPAAPGGKASAAVSVGSLNMYNALQMHDYGNIVFDDFSPGSVTKTLYDQFAADWNASLWLKNWDVHSTSRCFRWKHYAPRP